jgi:NADH dehydrogenase [ubiquinone] 1 alpha subcomplex assembly factor 7
MMWLQILTLPKVVLRFSKGLQDIHLVETSPAMRALQKEKLHSSVKEAGCQLHWHDSIDAIPPSDAFPMVVAHEFFDALPVHMLRVSLYHGSITSLPTHEL